MHFSTVKDGKAQVHELLNTLPAVDYAAAYGSGVMRQAGYRDTERPAIDVLLAVEDLYAFHEANMALNPSHYSCLRWLGPRAAAFVNRVGPGVYFHTKVFINGQEFKYGVVSLEKLCFDLRYWPWMYAAGRLHKPVVVLKNHPRVSISQSLNQQNAVVAARLLLPSRFSEKQLVSRICSLSYTGDVRMGIGENPNKVANIVAGQEHQLLETYAPMLDDIEARMPWGPTFTRQEDGSILQTHDSFTHLVKLLPMWMRYNMYHRIGGHDEPQVKVGRPELRSRLSQIPDLNSISEREQGQHITNRLSRRCALAGREATARMVNKQLKRVVLLGSLAQTAKGVLTTGLGRSLLYAASKVGKRFR